MGKMYANIFYKLIAKRLNKTEKTITEYFEKGVVQVILSEMNRGNTIVIGGFGTFTPKISGGCDDDDGNYVEEFKDFEFKPSNSCLNLLNGKDIEVLQKRMKTIADVRQHGHKFKDIDMEIIKERLTPILEKKLGRKDFVIERQIDKISQNKNKDN